MKRLIFAWVLFTSVTVSAQSDERTAKASPHNVSAVAGFNAGGFTFGVAYEHMIENSTGVQGHFRWFNKDEDRNVSGLFIVGGGLGHHFYKKSWDLAFTPTFNLINIDSAMRDPDDATVFGPGLTVSLVCNVTDNVAIGFDHSSYWAWFDDDWSGQLIEDLGVKVRLSF